ATTWRASSLVRPEPEEAASATSGWGREGSHTVPPGESAGAAPGGRGRVLYRRGGRLQLFARVVVRLDGVPRQTEWGPGAMLQEQWARVVQFLRKCGSVCVGYSGGVD